MKGDRIPSEHHLAIHCQPSAFIEKDAKGNGVSVGAAVFRVDPDGVSVDWLEFEGNDGAEQFRLTCQRLELARTVRKTHRVGILEVRAIEAVEA